MYQDNVISAFRPQQHHIDRTGYGYSRALNNDELVKMAPAIFAEQAHESRSDRYAYIPTMQLVDGMRNEGFFPVRVQQSRTRDESRAGYCKHLLRFRREEQLGSPEAREVVVVNSHDGSSGFQLMAGIYRLVCSNGLVVGKSDNEIRVRHSGDAISKVIEGAYSIVNDFDAVTEQIEGMKALPLIPEAQTAFANAALALRYENAQECPIKPEQLLRVRRQDDKGADLWSTFNVVQENMLKGGLRGVRHDELGRVRRTSTKTINGIDQNVALNRGLWVLAEQMRKLAA